MFIAEPYLSGQTIPVKALHVSRGPLTSHDQFSIGLPAPGFKWLDLWITCIPLLSFCFSWRCNCVSGMEESRIYIWDTPDDIRPKLYLSWTCTTGELNVDLRAGVSHNCRNTTSACDLELAVCRAAPTLAQMWRKEWRAHGNFRVKKLN